MKGMAYFMLEIIKQNWTKINQLTSIENIAQFILNKTFRGLGTTLINTLKPSRNTSSEQRIENNDFIDDMVQKIRKDYKI